MTLVTPGLHSYKPSRRLVFGLIGAFMLLFVSGITYIAWSLRTTVDDAEDFLSSGTDVLPLFLKETGPINNDPQKAHYLGLAEICVMQAEFFVMKKNYLAAHKAFAEANEDLVVAFDGNSVFLNVFLIREAAFEETYKKWSESEALLRKALTGLEKSSPNKTTLMSATRMLANVLQEQRKYSAAIVEYKKVVELANEYDATSKSKNKTSAGIWARNWLASCYWDARQYNDVIRTREEIDKMARAKGDKSELVDNLLSLGSARARAGHDDLALKDYDAVTVLDPANTDALRFKAEILSSSKNYLEALNCLNQAIKIDSKSTECLQDRAHVYMNMKNYEPAVSDLKLAISLDDYPYPRYELAACLSSMGRTREAIIEYTRILEKDDSEVWAYIYRGEVYQNLREYDLAISDYSKALKFPTLMKIVDESYSVRNSLRSQPIGVVVVKRRSTCYQALGRQGKPAD